MWGFHIAFLVAAVGMAVGLSQYIIGYKNLPAESRTVNECALPLLPAQCSSRFCLRPRCIRGEAAGRGVSAVMDRRCSVLRNPVADFHDDDDICHGSRGSGNVRLAAPGHVADSQ
ncbi:hypothetical protein [Rhodococcus sp. 3A]|uniref:hypothetical protein n=1 Tax=Rhodococcus sp. 3A TaxID=2834581 RepID=UPI0037C5AD5B